MESSQMKWGWERYAVRRGEEIEGGRDEIVVI